MANDNNNNNNENATSEKDRFHTFCWTKDDVARELQISKRMVVKLVHLDRIPYAKVGRLVRFCPARIKEWLGQGGTRWGKQHSPRRPPGSLK